MRVLHVIPSIGPARGGPSVALPAMARGLASRGIEVTIVTTDDNGAERLDVPLGEALIDGGITTRYFPRQTRFYTASWPLTTWLATQIHRYDLVHIHALFSYASAPAAFFAAQHRIPYIVRPLGTLNRWGVQHRRPWLKRLSFSLLERHILRGAAAIHYTSEQERAEAEELGVGTRAAVIPLGFDMTLFADLPPRSEFESYFSMLKGRIIILFLSRIDRKKGLDLLLPAFARVHRSIPASVLVIAGRGDIELTKQLQSQARELGVDESVLWTGFVEGREKLAALGAADVYVLPSYSENFGIAAVEAMAAGLPLVLSDEVAVSREVEGCGAGVVVPCDVDRLAEALVHSISDPGTRSRMAANSRSCAKERFSLDAMTDKLVTLYRDIAACEVATHG